MIDQATMDKIIKVPTEEEYIEDLTTKLSEAGFVITNFSKGGVFHILLWIIVHGLIELKQLGVSVVNSATMTHCPDDLVEVKAADYSKSLKEGVNTEGYVTVYRREYNRAVRILKGHPFTTVTDAGGMYLTFYASADTVLPEGQAVCLVPVIAEKTGSLYNVPAGRIRQTLVQIEGYDRVTNEEGWITVEGTETESIDSLRKRCINSRAENAMRNIDRKLKSIAESVKGVVVANVDSQSPRGEGTTDIIVTGQSGSANAQLLQAVREVIDQTRGSYGDYLVKSSIPVPIDFDVVLYVARNVSTDGYEETASAAIREIMDITTREELNRFYRDEIRTVLSEKIDKYRTCDIISPSENLVVGTERVFVTGKIRVTVKNIE